MLDFDEIKRRIDESIADGSFDAYFEGIFKYVDNQNRRVENKINSLSQNEIDELFVKVLSWEEKYENMYYKRHIETQSSLFTVVLKYAEDNGTEMDVSDSDESFL